MCIRGWGQVNTQGVSVVTTKQSKRDREGQGEGAGFVGMVSLGPLVRHLLREEKEVTEECMKTSRRGKCQQREQQSQRPSVGLGKNKVIEASEYTERVCVGGTTGVGGQI